MQALLQRVKYARVEVNGVVSGAIEHGLLVFVCAERGDTQLQADKLIDKISKLRIFTDEKGRMNWSVQDVKGSLLLVSQFTLAADIKSGTRPSFSQAAPPEEGRRLYDYVVEKARSTFDHVQTGIFGADMQVYLLNDGPVTIPMKFSPA